MAEFDLILRSGTVIDGTGANRLRADVGITADRIAAVGKLDGVSAREEIDALGLIVAPGFIDVHNHSDGWLLKTPNFYSKTLQGFTTEVLMSDGISYAPTDDQGASRWIYYLRSLNGLEQKDYQGWRSLGDYLALLDRRTAQNVVAQVPYANARVLAMGWRRAKPDDSQMRMIQREITRGLEDGAAALSTGLDYVNEFFADTDELVEACAPLRETQALYVTHVRYKKGVVAGVKEAVQIGRRAGVPVHISHLKGLKPEDIDELLEFIDNTAVHEVDFSFDVYPYVPGSTMLHSLLPYEVWEEGPLGVTDQLTRPEIQRRTAELLDQARPALDRIIIGWTRSKSNAHWQGKPLAELIQSRGKSSGEAFCDLLIEEGLAVLGVFHVGDDRLAEPFLKHPRFMLGTDGIFFPDGTVHPRQFGSAPRILGPLVREKKLFTLEDAVRKMSGYPAERFGLMDRGVIRIGAFADLTLFDAERITDRATYENPRQYAEGIQHVLVNGVPIVRNGQPLDEWSGGPPGRVLRFKK